MNESSGPVELVYVQNSTCNRILIKKIYQLTNEQKDSEIHIFLVWNKTLIQNIILCGEGKCELEQRPCLYLIMHLKKNPKHNTLNKSTKNKTFYVIVIALYNVIDTT